MPAGESPNSPTLRSETFVLLPATPAPPSPARPPTHPSSLPAVKGSNYCTSAARAVQLIVSNAIRLATVNVVGGVLLFLGKVAVAAGCGLVALAMSRMPYYNDATAYPATFLSSAILPIAVAVITGYIVAQVRGVTAGECGRCVAACGMAAVALKGLQGQ